MRLETLRQFEIPTTATPGVEVLVKTKSNVKIKE